MCLICAIFLLLARIAISIYLLTLEAVFETYFLPDWILEAEYFVGFTTFVTNEIFVLVLRYFIINVACPISHTQCDRIFLQA
jgi:hypothetical protein